MLFSIFGCSKEFNIIPDNAPIQLVVEGEVTNLAPPYYIRLTKSFNKQVKPNFSGNSFDDETEPVTNAIVTLSDDKGNIETLSYVGLLNSKYSDGWYKSENIIGVVGGTYTLKINYDNKTYKSVSTLPQPVTIDSVSFKEKYLAAKNSTVYIPLIYFRDPASVKNYYLIHYLIDGMMGSNRVWPYSVLDDKYITEYVNGLEVDDGQSADGKDFYSELYSGMGVTVVLESVNQSTYNFYKSIIDQFNADGGAFSSIPSTPISNIDGALGHFKTSYVSQKTKVFNMLNRR